MVSEKQSGAKACQYVWALKEGIARCGCSIICETRQVFERPSIHIQTRRKFNPSVYHRICCQLIAAWLFGVACVHVWCVPRFSRLNAACWLTLQCKLPIEKKCFNAKKKWDLLCKCKSKSDFLRKAHVSRLWAKWVNFIRVVFPSNHFSGPLSRTLLWPLNKLNNF